MSQTRLRTGCDPAQDAASQEVLHHRGLYTRVLLTLPSDRIFATPPESGCNWQDSNLQ